MASTARLFSILATAVLAAACGSDPDDPAVPDAGDGTADLTYWQDIKPIVDGKCVSCHYEGGIAPMALDTYDDVKVNAGPSKLAVHDDIMPPWPPANDCNDYLGDRSLSAEHKQMILDWIDAGAPEGDPQNPGAPIQIEDISLSRVDRTLTMAEDYVPVQEPDDYRCFLVPWEEETTTYVTGFRAVPGNNAIVHHVIAFLAQPDQVAEYQQLDADEEGPGYTCFGGTGGPAQEWIGAWAPGSLGNDMPDGTGIRIEPGSMIILQVHYNVLESDPQPDRTGIEVRLADTVEKEAIIMPWANPQWLNGTAMHIPPNQADVMHSFSFDATVLNDGQPMLIHSSSLHMHYLGTSGTIRINRADSTQDCLLDIPRWDFGWQGSYGHREPIQFNPGDQLYLECHWDNTPENQPTVNGVPRTPTDVYWGEGTTDEMCLGVFYVTDL
jgi:hypothetical protein